MPKATKIKVPDGVWTVPTDIHAIGGNGGSGTTKKDIADILPLLQSPVDSFLNELPLPVLHWLKHGIDLAILKK